MGRCGEVRLLAAEEPNRSHDIMKLTLPAILSVALALSAAPHPVLAKDLQDREASIWYLGHSGWAVETRSRFLIFDYREESEPDGPRSIDSGYIDPDQIKDRSVVVFISHGHGDHWDPRILEWKNTVPDITYVFGWKADKGPDHVYCEPERQELTLGGITIRTIVHDFEGIPESAFVVDLDGLTIFHFGDHGNGPPPFKPRFVDNIEYIAGIAPEIDLAFIPIWGEESFVVKTLKPKHTFPMHGLHREHQYAEFAARAKKEQLPTEVVAASARGDRFLMSNEEVKNP